MTSERRCGVWARGSGCVEVHGHKGPHVSQCQALVSEQAREIARLVEACYQEIPADVMPTMSGYACLLCGWDADPSMPDTHEPSCVLYRGAAHAARGGEGQG